MARAKFVKCARKDVKGTDIKKGESYYWWAFRYGGKRFSRKPPRPSQLTSSDFLSSVYAIGEEIEDLSVGDDLEDRVDELKEKLEELAGEQEDKLSNMPDSLQQGPTGELLQNRADACREMANELECLDLTNDEEEAGGEEWTNRQIEILEEIQNITYNGE